MDRREFIRCGIGLAGIIAASKAPAYVSKSILAGKGTMIADVDDAAHEVEWLQGDGQIGLIVPYETKNSGSILEYTYYRTNLNTQAISGQRRRDYASAFEAHIRHERNSDLLSRQAIYGLDSGGGRFSGWVRGNIQLTKKLTLRIDYENDIIHWWDNDTSPFTESNFNQIGLFGVSNVTGTAMYSYSTIKLCSFSISSQGTKVYDLVPMRIGSDGYVYDRVSEQILSPVGTGKFIVGPDKR